MPKHQGLVKNVEEETPEFVGINLESLDDVVIDVDDDTKLGQIVSAFLTN